MKCFQLSCCLQIFPKTFIHVMNILRSEISFPYLCRKFNKLIEPYCKETLTLFVTEIANLCGNNYGTELN